MSDQENKNQNIPKDGQKLSEGYQPLSSTIDRDNPPSDGTGVPPKINITQIKEKVEQTKK